MNGWMDGWMDGNNLIIQTNTECWWVVKALKAAETGPDEPGGKPFTNLIQLLQKIEKQIKCSTSFVYVCMSFLF